MLSSQKLVAQLQQLVGSGPVTIGNSLDTARWIVADEPIGIEFRGPDGCVRSAVLLEFSSNTLRLLVDDAPWVGQTIQMWLQDGEDSGDATGRISYCVRDHGMLLIGVLVTTRAGQEVDAGYTMPASFSEKSFEDRLHRD